MLIGYEWIADADSQAAQDNQHQALLDAGVVASHIYRDTENDPEERSGLEQCLSALQAGDMLLVWQLERLVNDRSHLLVVLRNLCQRNIGLKVLTGTGAILDTAHLNLKLVIDLITALNDLETQVLRKRTLKSQAAAREGGQAFGPPRKMTAAMLRQAMAAITESQRSITAIAEEIGITRATLYNYINGDGSLKPAGHKLLAQDQEGSS